MCDCWVSAGDAVSVRTTVLGVMFLNVEHINMFVEDHQFFPEGLKSYCSHTMLASITTTALDSTVRKKKKKKEWNEAHPLAFDSPKFCGRFQLAIRQQTPVGLPGSPLAI